MISDLQFVAERLVLYRITKVRDKNRELEFLARIIRGVIASSRGGDPFVPPEVSRLLGPRNFVEGQKLYEHFDDIVTVLEVMDSSELYSIIGQLRTQPLLTDYEE